MCCVNSLPYNKDDAFSLVFFRELLYLISALMVDILLKHFYLACVGQLSLNALTVSTCYAATAAPSGSVTFNWLGPSNNMGMLMIVPVIPNTKVRVSCPNVGDLSTITFSVYSLLLKVRNF